jgi:hypothetical protein
LGFSDLLGEDGQFKADAPWKDVLTPLQVDQYESTFKKYKSPSDLLRAMGHQTAMLGVGGDKITVPGEDSPASVVNAFREALGVPETPDGYGLEAPENLPEGIEWNEEQVKGITELLHKHNATPAMAKELIAFDLSNKAAQMAQFQEQQANQAAEQKTANMAQLKETWGNDTEANIGLAARMAIKEGIDPADPSLAHPATVKLLAKLAQMTSEDKLPINTGDHKMMNKTEAQAIMTDRGHPDYERYHSGTDPALMRKVQNMLINGG